MNRHGGGAGTSTGIPLHTIPIISVVRAESLTQIESARTGRHMPGAVGRPRQCRGRHLACLSYFEPGDNKFHSYVGALLSLDYLVLHVRLARCRNCSSVRPSRDETDR